MHSRSASPVQFCLDPLAELGRRRGCKVQVREGGAQVEAGAPDHDRAASLAQSRIDLGVRHRCERSHGERLVDRDEPEQPVREPRTLLLGRGAGQRFEPAVDLERVGGYRDRILAAGPQQVGERACHAGLADPGRPEDRDDVHRGSRVRRSARAAVPGRRAWCSLPSRSRPRRTHRAARCPRS